MTLLVAWTEWDILLINLPIYIYVYIYISATIAYFADLKTAFKTRITLNFINFNLKLIIHRKFRFRRNFFLRRKLFTLSLTIFTNDPWMTKELSLSRLSLHSL